MPRGARTAPATVGGIAGEWVTADGVPTVATLLYLHGGGYFACTPKTYRPVTSSFALAGFRTFAPDYRLAPEHPFPAGLEDAIAAYRGLLQDHAPHELVVAGDSAGGGLSVALLLSLRERGIPLPAAAALFSPFVDLAATGESAHTNSSRCAMFTRESFGRAAQYYLGDGDRCAPLASPLYADLQGLPPLLIHVGTDETLLDDSRRLAERAQLAGVKTQLKAGRQSRMSGSCSNAGFRKVAARCARRACSSRAKSERPVLARRQAMSKSSAQPVTLQVSESCTVSGLLEMPANARACFVFAHGAGAGMHHASMASVAADLSQQGIATLRYQFPYMERGSRRPDPPALCHATVRAAVAEAARVAPGLRLVAGGRSFGGRMTSQAQALAPLAGVVGLALLAFPLHPAGRPSQERADHLSNVENSDAVPAGDTRRARDARAAAAGRAATGCPSEAETPAGRRPFISRACLVGPARPGRETGADPRAGRVDRRIALMSEDKRETDESSRSRPRSR